MWTLRDLVFRDYLDRLVRSSLEVSVVEFDGEFFVKKLEELGPERSVTFYVVDAGGIVSQFCSNLHLRAGQGFTSHTLAAEFAIRFFGIKKAKGRGQYLHRKPAYEPCGLLIGGNR